jgi:hypothetical protein
MAELSQGLNTLDAGTVTWREVTNNNLVLINGLYLVAVGLASARPAAPGAGDIKGYYATDTNVLSVYTGGVWVQVNATTLPDPLTIATLQASGTGGIEVKNSAGTTVATIGKTGAVDGGNARGANAVDWQLDRGVATQVASGARSVLGGGRMNTASGTGAAVLGGDANVASGQNSFIGGGNANAASGGSSVAAGGSTNRATGENSTVGGGSENEASGALSAITGGFYNTAYNYCETIAGRFCTISAGNQTGITTADRLFAIGNGTSTSARSAAFEVFGNGNVDVADKLSAALLERTPILPPWDDAANPAPTAGDSGGTFAFTGTCDLPDATTLPEGWEVTLIFNAVNASCASNGGNIIDPSGNFSSTAIFENGSGRAVLRLICDGSDYIAASQTGSIFDV